MTEEKENVKMSVETDNTDALEQVEEVSPQGDEPQGEKDYLDPSLFDDIKELSPEQLHESAEPKDMVSSEVLDKYHETVSDIAEHQVVQGRVIGQNEKEIIMDIGFKSEGIIPRSEFAGKVPPAIGDVLGVYLERMEDKNGQTLLSKEKADWMNSWNKIIEIYKGDGTVEGKIVRRIKGGMVVELEGIQAFLPGSQIDIRPVQDFDQYLGQEMEFKVVKVNRLRKNIVLSRKVLLEESLREQREALFEEIETGQILEGHVKNITDFGAFIDLGGVDGLLHITDLSWGRVNHPSDVVELGEALNVKVIDVDREKQRVSLGLKQLSPHPWETVPGKYPVGTRIKGKVVSLTNYGAFLELEKGVEGLVHVSEMSWTRNVFHPSEVVKLGEEVEAEVLSLNPEDRKIALGFKQLQPDPWEGVEERYQVDSLYKGTVRNLRQFGAFVELEEGVDGLIHISDLSWTKLVRHPKEILEKGDEVEVRVLEASRESRRIALGLKQATEDPWPAIKDHFQPGEKVTGQVIKVLDKGVILELDMDVEGIIPSRMFSRDSRKEMLGEISPGVDLRCEVVEVRPDDKKVILDAPEFTTKGKSASRGLDGEDETPGEKEKEEETSEKRKKEKPERKVTSPQEKDSGEAEEEKKEEETSEKRKKEKPEQDVSSLEEKDSGETEEEKKEEG
ncbi:MAG: 30S ribosomal protein S1 [Candidatus Neomarinimicrobiota bacterium]